MNTLQSNEIYTDYSQCYDNCINGQCQFKYNDWLQDYTYYCDAAEEQNKHKVLLIIIAVLPVIIILLSLLLIFNNKKKQAQGQRAQVVPTQAQTPQTQVNQNVTGVAPQGQLVTLPNGQVGIFIPLTQPQQTQVRQVQAQQQQQAPQFYQPQPIYQQQIYQPQRVVVQQQVPQQVQQTIPTYSNFQQQQAPQRAVEYVQMPIMPAMPQ
ncbi:Hypothetical_protein [Hexamita inflata]|uniref:Hypothetical_protein n=1 Tax=Hexamita inflata TaxID=28002 RepID=A0AA86QVY2_9EUKA|nr:Hypothetical protein HINF_LOCUS49462 [Hexamita inflata]CAI9973401.1 Hypothetical protein HINF_LOCUS61046 [Hexamita inflata]